MHSRVKNLKEKLYLKKSVRFWKLSETKKKKIIFFCLPSHDNPKIVCFCFMK